MRLIDDEQAQPPESAGDARFADKQRESDVVSLDPDVKAVFADSRAVNEALRLLIKTAKSAQELAKAS